MRSEVMLKIHSLQGCDAASLHISQQSCYRPELAYRVDRGIALSFCDLGARRGWVVSTMPWPLYLQERPSIHCTGGWVGPRAGLEVCEKSRPNRDSMPGLSSL
jgi:hypothetical protein